jgi:hypothetical protein
MFKKNIIFNAVPNLLAIHQVNFNHSFPTLQYKPVMAKSIDSVALLLFYMAYNDKHFYFDTIKYNNPMKKIPVLITCLPGAMARIKSTMR